MAREVIVLGMRARTGAAQLIAIGPGPRLVGRARAVLAAPGREFCYHLAAEMTLARAEASLRAARADAAARAVTAIRALVDEVGAIARAGLVRGKPTALPALPQIMKVHALWHAAEGVHYRDALEAACAELDLAVIGVPAVELAGAAAAAEGVGEAGLRDRLAALGRAAGPPWTVEPKEAAMAALVALHASARRR
jgi:hypothetical protein